MKNSGICILGLCIVLAFASLGYALYAGIMGMKSMERTVVVKGLSEREVMANEVVWPINFKVAANSLEDLYARNEEDTKKIVDFLLNNGIEMHEISVLMPSIEDKTAYASQNNMPLYNYMAHANVVVSSDKVEQIAGMTESIAVLMKDGVAFSGMSGNVTYTFTKLNELKPIMVEDATKNAREVAERFAKDSDSFLGKIRKANQGQFSISTPDHYKPQMKSVRVVSTVEYYLVD